jgi:hypothetical protein
MKEEKNDCTVIFYVEMNYNLFYLKILALALKNCVKNILNFTDLLIMMIQYLYRNDYS